MAYKQLLLFEDEFDIPFNPTIDLHSYDYYILATSGGKDSIACLCTLIKEGVDLKRVELWHHCIDGKIQGNSHQHFMDWPVTEDYTRKLAQVFKLPIYFSWKEGGFEREMLRKNSLTAPTVFECPDPINGDSVIECSIGGVRGKCNTRLKFPQVCADLSKRWCSAYLKIDVCTSAINNQLRFLNKRTLVITGERAEESAARSRYKKFEPDRSDNRNGKRVNRHVDHWRAVHDWSEKEVWEILKEFRIVPHPAYRLGWNRLSCIACIFGSPNQWASVKHVAPGQFNRIASYEKSFNHTINRKYSVLEQVAKGTPYTNMNPELISIGLNTTYTDDIFTDNWTLPAGAFGESVGPT